MTAPPFANSSHIKIFAKSFIIFALRARESISLNLNIPDTRSILTPAAGRPPGIRLFRTFAGRAETGREFRQGRRESDDEDSDTPCAEDPRETPLLR